MQEATDSPAFLIWEVPIQNRNFKFNFLAMYRTKNLNILNHSLIMSIQQFRIFDLLWIVLGVRI